jgi:predicted nucleic-acid-binding protein
MIGLDTNVLVRYLAQDDPVQSPRATKLIEHTLGERNPGYVGMVTLIELSWVLKRLYGVRGRELHDALRDLLEARQLVVEQRPIVTAALARWAGEAGDFADALVVECARAAGCRKVMTFDVAAAGLGMTSLR